MVLSEPRYAQQKLSTFPIWNRTGMILTLSASLLAFYDKASCVHRKHIPFLLPLRRLLVSEDSRHKFQHTTASMPGTLYIYAVDTCYFVLSYEKGLLYKRFRLRTPHVR